MKLSGLFVIVTSILIAAGCANWSAYFDAEREAERLTAAGKLEEAAAELGATARVHLRPGTAPHSFALLNAARLYAAAGRQSDAMRALNACLKTAGEKTHEVSSIGV